MKDFKKRATEPAGIMQQLNEGFEGGGSMRRQIGETVDDAGLQITGYITKKGITVSEATNPETRYNQLPPGMYIDDQKRADIRPLEMKTVTGMGYPGDGWTGKSDDLGI